ncbi:MAG: hybrid sensor histidine kinase/response regulator [Odoribacter sp.]|nr:hybrid sensor histidine kinase/response regulator [Odoribacter sp.]
MNDQDKTKEEFIKVSRKFQMEQDLAKGKTVKDVEVFTYSDFGKRLALILLSLIFVGELLIMLLLSNMRIHLYWVEALTDSLILSILIFPAIYFYVVRPMAIQTTKFKKVEQELIITIRELVFQSEEKEKRTAELIIEKSQAQESDRLKSAFLANMSHEIRTPMNGILGFAGLLKEAELTGEQQQEYIGIIEKSGIRMLNIINDIVDISKIESGLMKVEMKLSNINEQIEYIHNFFKPEAEAKGIQLSYKNSLTAKEAVIKTDREKLYAILINLIKNAIKYTDHGSIEFGYGSTLRQAQSDASSTNGSVSEPVELQFYVKDTGIGIPKNRQEAIFERFIQAEIADKMARQGAGLGLAITKSYVEMLGGKIWVESEEGKGSTFCFTLPFNTEPEEKATVKKTVAAEGAEDLLNPEGLRLKILIVEDDETSEMLISIMVKLFGSEILKAQTGLQAIELCRNNPDIDLILMDIQLPEIDGYEATKQIRRFNKEVVIIAQTAYGLSGDREKAIEAECNDYISKPIQKDQLLGLIQKYFKNRETDSKL